MDLKKITFPNNLECYYIGTKEEAELLFREIFIDQQYLKNGIVINQGDCIFDVGANIGLFPLFLNQFAKSLKFYSFEPIKPIFEVLRENIGLHSIQNISLFNYGLSLKNNPETSFTFYPNSPCISTIKPEENLDFKDILKYVLKDISQEQIEYLTQTSKVMGELKTLSFVINELDIQRIDLLKIDVEGAEYDVLQGIEEKDWNKIQQIVIEVKNIEGRLEQINKMLKIYGFDIKAEKNNFIPTGFSETYNIYAIRK